MAHFYRLTSSVAINVPTVGYHRQGREVGKYASIQTDALLVWVLAQIF